MEYEKVLSDLNKSPKTWLVTGVAGFIGSNILELLLQYDQKVIGLDNFITGHKANLDDVREFLPDDKWRNFKFIEGDITILADCRKACVNVDYVLHQAALGSVPRSLADPITTNNANISGFLNMLVAARDAKVKSFVYAASSSTYGDHSDLPKKEDIIGNPLSPYAITKYVNELYAQIFYKSYGLNSIGLRYFNVFGKRQDPAGAYAAVIPKWIYSLINNEKIFINGDGKTSRDFCFVDNAVQANILAATAGKESLNQIYNVAVGARTSLNDLVGILQESLSQHQINSKSKIIYRDFRPGDVAHSQADISKAKARLGYLPEFTIKMGIDRAIAWYIQNTSKLKD